MSMLHSLVDGLRIKNTCQQKDCLKASIPYDIYNKILESEHLLI
jgi:hypothetical protein